MKTEHSIKMEIVPGYTVEITIVCTYGCGKAQNTTPSAAELSAVPKPEFSTPPDPVKIKIPSVPQMVAASPLPAESRPGREKYAKFNPSREELESTLKKNSYNINKTAKQFGTLWQQLSNKMRQYGIEVPEPFRSQRRRDLPLRDSADVNE